MFYFKKESLILGVMMLFFIGCTLQNNIAGLVLGEHEQSKSVQKGWNFFSAPVSGTLSSTVPIVLYSYENGQWQIKSDRALVGGKAYWVDAAAAGGISLPDGVPVSSVAVAQGVNAFGIPSLNPLRHTQLRLGATFLAEYTLYTWDGTAYQLVASDAQLEPAKGYVLMNAPLGDILFDMDEDGMADAICGDEIQQSTEECDDGNTVGGDGCSATCTVECPAVDSSCTADPNSACSQKCCTSADGSKKIVAGTTCPVEFGRLFTLRSSDGSTLGTTILMGTTPFDPKAVAVASDGSSWVLSTYRYPIGEKTNFNQNGWLKKVSPTGTVTRSIEVGVQPRALALKDETVWVLNNDKTITKITPQAKETISLPIYGGDLALDGAGNVWITGVDKYDKSKVVIITPAGVTSQIDITSSSSGNKRVIGTPGAGAWIIDAGERVWLGDTQSSPGQIFKVGADGAVLKTIEVPDGSPRAIARAPDGTFWVLVEALQDPSTYSPLTIVFHYDAEGNELDTFFMDVNPALLRVDSSGNPLVEGYYSVLGANDYRYGIIKVGATPDQDQFFDTEDVLDFAGDSSEKIFVLYGSCGAVGDQCWQDPGILCQQKCCRSSWNNKHLVSGTTCPSSTTASAVKELHIRETLSTIISDVVQLLKESITGSFWMREFFNNRKIYQKS